MNKKKLRSDVKMFEGLKNSINSLLNFDMRNSISKDSINEDSVLVSNESLNDLPEPEYDSTLDVPMLNYPIVQAPKSIPNPSTVVKDSEVADSLEVAKND